jgi:hypothetical protein
MTAEQYKASWSGGAPPVEIPNGLVFHAGMGEGREFFTMTVWESREAYESFALKFKESMSQRGFDFGNPVILDVHHTIRTPSRT